MAAVAGTEESGSHGKLGGKKASIRVMLYDHALGRLPCKKRCKYIQFESCYMVMQSGANLVVDIDALIMFDRIHRLEAQN